MNIDDSFEKYVPMIRSHFREAITKHYGSDFFIADTLLNGKHIRPVLTLLIADTYNGDIDKALKLGCALECCHQASLIVDDIIDDTQVRRGEPSLHMKLSKGKAFIAAVSLFTFATEMSSSYHTEQIRLADTIHGMVRGVLDEVSDIEEILMNNISNAYRHMVDLKTAELFATAAYLGAVSCPNMPTKEVEAFESFGRYVGRMYQITDDITDIEEDRMTNVMRLLMDLGVAMSDDISRIAKKVVAKEIPLKQGISQLEEVTGVQIISEMQRLRTCQAIKSLDSIAWIEKSNQIRGYGVYISNMLLKQEGIPNDESQ